MKFRWQRGWGGNRRSLPYLVFLLSIAATVSAWLYAALIVGAKDRERFRYATEEAELAIRGRIDDQVDLLRASAATFSLQGGWTREQFRSYAQHLGLSSNFGGSQGLGYIRRTQPSDVAALEKQLRAEGESEFQVRPVSTGREMFPIVYLEPETAANAPSIGYDGYSDSVRREAMVEARDSAQPTISGVVESRSSRVPRRSQIGFLLYCPIYQGGQTPTTVEERRRLLVGFVYSRFRGSDIFHNVLEGEARHALDIEILDAPPGQYPKRFYTSSATAVLRTPRIEQDGGVWILGRQWLIRYHSSLDFERQSAAWLVSWIPIAGILVSGLLAAVSFGQVRAYRQLNDQAATLARLFDEKEGELEERRKAEAQVRRLNENLEHLVEDRTTELRASNKELEAFCYSVSHDLRAPLRSVDGFSKSLLEDYGAQLDEQARDYIGRVRNASHRMDELISALLNLSRITRLEIVRQRVDVTQIAAHVTEDALEGKDATHFDVAIQPNMTADADPKLLRVLLDNLVRNAVKFSAPVPHAKIEVGYKDSVFFVKDNGVGFNPAYGEKLFIAFERLHTQSEFPGSGIGLATVERIVQRHGGRVWAESELGKGATFYFTLR